MKPEDLRIGNLVRQKGIEGDLGIIEVESIHDDGINVRAETYYHGYDEYRGLEADYAWKEIEGIPLTEEWLERFGLEKVGCISTIYEIEVNLEHIKYFNVHIEEGVLSISVDCYGKEQQLIEIEYVHQLQNFYHSLKGEDLPTKG